MFKKNRATIKKNLQVIQKFIKKIGSAYTTFCVVSLLTDFQCPKKNKLLLMINKEIGSWLTQNWLHFCVSDTLVKVKNLKLLDLRHNKMKEVSAYLSFFYYYSNTSVNAMSFFCHLHTVMASCSKPN